MSSVNYVPVENNNNKPKDNRSLIYGLLIAALLLTWGYVIYDKSNTKDKIDTLTSQNITSTNERDEVRELYNSSLARLDSLTGENQLLTDSLTTRDTEVTRLKNDIRKILNDKNASSSDLAKAKRMIKDLNGRIETLAMEVDRLKGENEILVADNDRLSTEKREVETRLTATSAQKDSIEGSLNKTRNIASTLSASNINIVGINTKKSGKESETSRAKKADKLRINFDLEPNRIADNGEKTLFVAITAPDGTPIVLDNSSNFTSAEEGDKPFTAKVSVKYENNKKVPVSFDWQPNAQFQTGNYKIEIYHNGYKIGEGLRNLKKAGLFG